MLLRAENKQKNRRRRKRLDGKTMISCASSDILRELVVGF